MDLRSACLATAKLFRDQAKAEPARKDCLLAEADKWEKRAETKLRLALHIEGEAQPRPAADYRHVA